MSRLALLLAGGLLGCAVARITLPDGARLDGWAIGNARIVACGPGGVASSPGGAFTGPCARVDGGETSATFAGIMAALFTAAVAIATSGAVGAW